MEFNRDQDHDDCCHTPGETYFPKPCSASAPFALDKSGTCHSAFIETSGDDEELCGGEVKDVAFVPHGTQCTAKCAKEYKSSITNSRATFTCVDGVWEGQLVCGYALPVWDPQRINEETAYGNAFNTMINPKAIDLTDENSITLYNGNVYRAYPERSTFGGSLQAAAATMFCGVHGHMATFSDADELQLIGRVVRRSHLVYSHSGEVQNATDERKLDSLGDDPNIEQLQSGPYRFWIPLVASGRKALGILDAVMSTSRIFNDPVPWIYR